jgi:hypothetical protein
MKEGYEIYEAYIDGHQEEVARGEEIVVEVRDLAQFVRKVVRAKIAKPPATLPEGQKLWVRGYDETPLQEPWIIQVVEELDDEVQLERKKKDSSKADDIYG